MRVESCATPMTCEQCADNFTAYIEGELTDEERQAFEAHLAACPACSEALVAFRKTVALLRSLGPVDAPGDLPDRVLAELESSGGKLHRPWWSAASGFAAAAALMLTFAFWHFGVFQQHPTDVASAVSPPAVQSPVVAPVEPEAAPQPPSSATTGAMPSPPRAAADTQPAKANHEPTPARPSEHQRSAALEDHAAPVPAPPAAVVPAPNNDTSAPAPAPFRVEGAVQGFDGGGGSGALAGAPSRSGPLALGSPGGSGPAVKSIGPGVAAMSVETPPVEHGTVITILPPASCVVGRSAWISIAIVSDVADRSAQLRVRSGAGVEVVGADEGLVYRGPVERGKILRVPVEIISERPGRAMLHVTLHSDKPELIGAVTVFTPPFVTQAGVESPRQAAARTISFDFHETPLRQAFEQIAGETGAHISAGQGVTDLPVTIDFSRGVPLEAALRILADAAGCTVVRNRDIYCIDIPRPNRGH